MSAKTATRTDQPETKLDTVKKSAAYLMYGSAAGASAVPKGWKTRSVLTTARYFSKYIFWRVLRYAKYAIAVSLCSYQTRNKTEIWRESRLTSRLAFICRAS